jgi:hypothetical protein
MHLRVSISALFAAGALFAQTASITGRVSDPSGAVVPGVQIEVRSLDSGLQKQSETNSEGYYSVPALAPGRYEVAFTKTGFVLVRETGLTLTVQQVARLDIVLRIGEMTQRVEVSAQSVLLDSETSTMGQVVGSRQLTELPLLGRNPYALAMLVPGVRPSSGVNDLPVNQVSSISYSINGQRASQNEFLLDGAPNSAPAQNQVVINANPDAVQEFKVETNTFSAEYGRAGGGIFNVVTKSGGNELHFSMYEFLRNDKLNANDFFANTAGSQKPPFRFNQFGGTIGGPVVLPRFYDGRNRTFFFASAELVRFVQGITFTATVPDPVQLTGDFNGVRNAAGNPITIYDPLTTMTASSGGFTRSPFAGNRIPENRIDPVARNISKYWPAPNAAGNPVTGLNNFSRPDGTRVEKNTFSTRLDHNFSDRQRIFWRYSYDDTPWIRALPYGIDNPASPGAGPQVFTRQNTVLEDTHVFSPSLLMSLRYSLTRLANKRPAHAEGFDITTLGFPPSLRDQIGDPRAFPAINVTGMSVSGSVAGIVLGGALGAPGIINMGNLVHALQGSVTKSASSHTLKMGGEFRVIQLNNQQTGNTSTQFSFTPQWTQGPNPTASSATAGIGLASFLLGLGSGNVTPAPAIAQTTRYYGLFVQDTYKVTPKLTLNLGMRYEYESPRTDRFNQLTNFDYDAPLPLQIPGLELRGGLTFAGVDGAPRQQAAPDRNNFAPRLGISYRLTTKTVVRAGAGIFFTPLTGLNDTVASLFGLSGFLASTDMVSSLDGVTPLNYLRNPYPGGLNLPTGNSLGLLTLLGQPIAFYDRGNRIGYSGQWNLNVQRELPGSLLMEVGYVGTRGLKLLQDRSFNQLPDSALSLGDALRQQVANPFYGKISVGTLAQPTVARAQLLRPFPQFNDVTSAVANWASSSYHAFQFRLEKRFGHGFSSLASYTWSKLLDYGIGAFGGEALSGSNFQNWNNVAAEWSPSTTDQTHRFIVNAVYDLPSPKNWGKVAENTLGGWEVAGILSGFSGGPLGVTSSVNNTFSQGGGQRPNWTGVSPRLDNPTPTRWFDTTQFSAPAPYRFGNAPRTFGGSRSDGTGQLDLMVSKNIRFFERFNLQFRTEFFNLANHARFAPPNVTFGSPQFGVVSSQGNTPRIIQFGLKLRY